MGNTDIIKLYATLASPAASGGARGDGASGAAPVNPTPGTGVGGVGCLNVGQSVEHSPAWRKIEILNCLIFNTPRSFWVTQSTKTVSTNDLASAIDMRYRFLGYGDWTCTHAVPNLPEHPFEPSCVKHDVAYASLQKFAGEGDSANERDSAWNPRNKYLADIEFHADLQKDVAQWSNLPSSCLSFGALTTINLYLACKIYKSNIGLLARAHITYFGVAYGNSKFWAGWPITASDEDKKDARQNYRFVVVE